MCLFVRFWFPSSSFDLIVIIIPEVSFVAQTPPSENIIMQPNNKFFYQIDRHTIKPKIQTNDNKAQNTKRYGLLITELNKECVVCNLNLLYQINIMHKFWNKCTNYFSIFGTIRQFGSWGHFALENTIISFDDVGNGNQSGHFFLRCTKVIGIKGKYY